MAPSPSTSSLTSTALTFTTDTGNQKQYAVDSSGQTSVTHLLTGGSTRSPVVNFGPSLFEVSSNVFHVKSGSSLFDNGITAAAATVLGTSQLNGPVNATAALNVTGAAAFAGPVTAGSSLNVTGTSTLATLAVTGASTLTGPVTASGTLGVTGPVTASGTLGVTGASTLTGAVTAQTTLAVNGASTLTGAVTADSTLTVSGASLLSGAVTASSTLGVQGASTLTGPVSAQSTLAVLGPSTLTTLSVTDVSTFSGPVTANSTLLVTDAATLQKKAFFGDDIHVTGQAQFDKQLSVLSGGMTVGGNSILTGTLEISDTVTANSYGTHSDERLKDNISNVTSSFAELHQLRPVSFTWKANGRPSIGFLAQELLEVFPDIVDVRNTDRLAVDYNCIIPLLVHWVQQLEQRVQALEARSA